MFIIYNKFSIGISQIQHNNKKTHTKIQQQIILNSYNVNLKRKNEEIKYELRKQKIIKRKTTTKRPIETSLDRMYNEEFQFKLFIMRSVVC